MSNDVDRPEPGLDLGALTRTLWQGRRHLLLGALLGALVSGVTAFTLPPVFTATARLLPPQSASSNPASAMLGQLAVLTGGNGPQTKSLGDTFVGMLHSRTVADALISQFQMDTVYGSDLRSNTRSLLAQNTQIRVGRTDGIIEISVDDHDAKRAAALANGYVDQLKHLNQALAVTEAAQRRLFFQQQLEDTRKKLQAAEATAKSALDRNGLVKVDEQGKSLVEEGARLRAGISAKQVQLKSMQTYASEQSTEMVKLRAELAALQSQLDLAEGRGLRPAPQAGKVDGHPDSLALIREVKYYEALFELMARQYEMARIDESKDSAQVQVLAVAEVPDWKSGPQRIKLTAEGLLLGLLLGATSALWRNRRSRLANTSVPSPATVV